MGAGGVIGVPACEFLCVCVCVVLWRMLTWLSTLETRSRIAEGGVCCRIQVLEDVWRMCWLVQQESQCYEHTSHRLSGRVDADRARQCDILR